MPIKSSFVDLNEFAAMKSTTCQECQASHYKVRIVDDEWVEFSVGLVLPYVIEKAKEAWM